MSYFLRKNIEMPTRETALPGRKVPIPVEPEHFVNGRAMVPPFPAGLSQIVLGMGCFWGAEKAFWDIEGVYVTAVGYAGGYTEHPSYEETCTGMTGHTEVVLCVFDEQSVSLASLLNVFWERHDPTQGMRQGNDTGTQYRSAILYSNPEHLQIIEESRAVYQLNLTNAGYGKITTQIAPLDTFYYAETYHQQYLAKNPNGYCGLGGTGVSCRS